MNFHQSRVFTLVGLVVFLASGFVNAQEVDVEQATPQAEAVVADPAPAAVADPTPASVADPDPVNAEQEEAELRFSFSGTNWADVLDWFAEQADLALEVDQPPLGTFSFSDPTEWLGRAKDAGKITICQTQTIDDVEVAVDAGADAIAVQGNEAGGHTGRGS